MLTSNDPQQRATGQAATATEYANLTAAVSHALGAGQLVMDLVSPLETCLDQVQQRNAQRRLIDDVIAGYPAAEEHDKWWELGALHNLAGGIPPELKGDLRSVLDHHDEQGY